jgi:spore coat polysaccharide biosynthesis protein SpsF
MGSTRLPGKVLELLAGTPMAGRVAERAKRIEGVDRVVFAIPRLAEDDPLASYLESLTSIEVHRGSPDDVLDRYLQAAREHEAEVVMRLTADCPLLCPEVSARVLSEFRETEPDYASNTILRTFPRGLDTEVFSRAALEQAASEATRESDREHVTPFIWRHPDRFAIRHVVGASDASDLRWTVDAIEDLEMVSALLELLSAQHGRGSDTPTYEELLRLARQHPEITEINRDVRQREIGP